MVPRWFAPFWVGMLRCLYINRQRSTAMFSCLRMRNYAIFHPQQTATQRATAEVPTVAEVIHDRRSRVCVQPDGKLWANRTFSVLPHPFELLLTFFNLPVVMAEPLCRVLHTHILISPPDTTLKVWNITSTSDGEHSPNVCGAATSV